MNEWIQNEFEYIQLKQKIKEYTFNTEKNICIIQFWCFIIHDKYRMLKIKSVWRFSSESEALYIPSTIETKKYRLVVSPIENREARSRFVKSTNENRTRDVFSILRDVYIKNKSLCHCSTILSQKFIFICALARTSLTYNTEPQWTPIGNVCSPRRLSVFKGTTEGDWLWFEGNRN